MKPHSGLTRLGCAVTTFLVLMTILVIIPMFNRPYINSGRIRCMYKQKEIVMAMNSFHSTYKRFPPSCHVKKSDPNKDGYSFLVDCLPMMEQEALWKRLDVLLPLDAENDLSEPRIDRPVNLPNEALAMSMPMFHCSASWTPSYIDEEAPSDQLLAITSYKAVCATTRAAYEVSSRTDIAAEGLDIYGIGLMKKSSDGAIYVGSKTTIPSIADGTACTFLLTETDEPIYSRWIVGQECGLYTMPDDAAFQGRNPEKNLLYVSPAGFTPGRYNDESTIPKEKRKTNLNRDYAKSPYPWGETGFRSERYTGDGKTPGTKFGPSSSHPDVVIHAYVRCNTASISKNIDPAAYFFQTTRAGGDPAPDLDDLRG